MSECANISYTQVALNLSKVDTCNTQEGQTDNKRFVDECHTFGEDVANYCALTINENHFSSSLYATLPRAPKSVVNGNTFNKPTTSLPSSIMTRSYSDISSVTATISLPASTPPTRTLTENVPSDEVKASPVKLLSIVTSEPTVATMASLKEYAPPSPSYEEVKEEIFKSTIATAITPPLHQRTARTPSKLAIVKPQVQSVLCCFAISSHITFQQKIIERTPSPRPNTELRPRRDSNTTLEQTKAAIKSRVEVRRSFTCASFSNLHFRSSKALSNKLLAMTSQKVQRVYRQSRHMQCAPLQCVTRASQRIRMATTTYLQVRLPVLKLKMLILFTEPIPPPRTRGLMTSSSTSSIPVRTRYTIQTTTRESAAGTTTIRYTSRRDSGSFCLHL